MKKIERLHARGTVFRYPYAWQPEDPAGPQPKDRPVCLLLELETSAGAVFLGIVAISDKPNKERGMSMPVPADEMKRAGLTDMRMAYVHLDQYNIDRRSNSYTYDPKVQPMGAFSRAFTAALAETLAQNIRTRRALRIDRA